MGYKKYSCHSKTLFITFKIFMHFKNPVNQRAPLNLCIEHLPRPCATTERYSNLAYIFHLLAFATQQMNTNRDNIYIYTAKS